MRLILFLFALIIGFGGMFPLKAKPQIACKEEFESLPSFENSIPQLEFREMGLNPPDGSEGSNLIIYSNILGDALFLKSAWFLSNSQWQVILDLRKKPFLKAKVNYVFYNDFIGSETFDQNKFETSFSNLFFCSKEIGWQVLFSPEKNERILGTHTEGRLTNSSLWQTKIEKMLKVSENNPP